MRVGECIQQSGPHIGCYLDVTNELQQLCADQQCTFSSMSMFSIPSLTNTCSNDHSPFLEVGMSCE